MTTTTATQTAVPHKSVGVTYLLLLLLGVLGAHKFYLGRYGWGIVYLFTLGLLGFGLLVDLFTVTGQVRRRNTELFLRGAAR